MLKDNELVELINEVKQVISKTEKEIEELEFDIIEKQNILENLK
jgi:peptidoglycan hydrolase CwlO-like protein